jgi:hypothetical protein
VAALGAAGTTGKPVAGARGGIGQRGFGHLYKFGIAFGAHRASIADAAIALQKTARRIAALSAVYFPCMAIALMLAEALAYTRI